MLEPFFLHVLPRRADDLESTAAEYGFENLDFWFESNGTQIGERCIIERRLPDYDIEQIRTGQYEAETSRKIWQADISIGTPSSFFKVFRRGVDGLVYKKIDCTLADVQHPFFLHVRPTSRADASDWLMTPDGYANLDFTVDLAGVLRGDGSCVIERKVPFDFIDLTTGQYDSRTFKDFWRRDIERA